MGPNSGIEVVSFVGHSCFHSTDSPSEWGPGRTYTASEELDNALVSIQLIAPASGAHVTNIRIVGSIGGFHSTDCPSEWGPSIDAPPGVSSTTCFHSTDCPSEWGLVSQSPTRLGSPENSFHSTDCPSEWGLDREKLDGVKHNPSFHSTDCPSEWGQQALIETALDRVNWFPFN